MAWSRMLERPRRNRNRKRIGALERKPACESLETRTVAASSAGLSPLGQIAGRVINESSGVGVGRVQVELIDAQGRIANRAFTNAAGDYAFNVARPGPYSVHEVTPRGLVQVSPSFTNAPPVGSYDPGANNGSYNYTSDNANPANGQVGPAGWVNIALAGLQPFQSPINLRGPTINLNRVLNVSYAPTVPSAAVNDSHQIQVRFAAGSGSFVIAGGTRYDLAAVQYHAPAEHRVNGRAALMEQQFVNVSASGGVAIVSVFLELGVHNSALDAVFNAATLGLTTPNTSTVIPTPIHFSELLPGNAQGWFYQGSLTAPPLSQPVSWFVYANPIRLDRTQLAQYKAVATSSGFLPNARPLQPLDGRALNQINAQINYTGQTVAANFGLLPG